jgi:hypothetical protein
MFSYHSKFLTYLTYLLEKDYQTNQILQVLQEADAVVVLSGMTLLK